MIRDLLHSLRARLTGEPEECSGPVEAHDVDAPHPIDALRGSAVLGLQRMQGGLPVRTQKAWRAIQAAFPGLLLGAWGDSKHKARKSCHNPGKAIDVMTADPKKHAAIVAWALEHRAEHGFTLIISRRLKWSKATGWKPVPYRGADPHISHVHLSVDC